MERFAFDVRWNYAAGRLGFDYPGFAHTAPAKEAGVVDRRHLLDSTPLYDAVITTDTVTLIRSAIHGLLNVAGVALEAELRKVLRRVDSAAGKPLCDYNNAALLAAALTLIVL